ncbi:hypothetical protein ADK43_28540 [Streptomyces rimosus subsp. rimosus]|nr:hypothetical protein ADK43_28540 [Streptomyces rimosus subsp. rimosus]
MSVSLRAGGNGLPRSRTDMAARRGARPGLAGPGRHGTGARAGLFSILFVLVGYGLLRTVGPVGARLLPVQEGAEPG